MRCDYYFPIHVSTANPKYYSLEFLDEPILKTKPNNQFESY